MGATSPFLSNTGGLVPVPLALAIAGIDHGTLPAGGVPCFNFLASRSDFELISNSKFVTCVRWSFSSLSGNLIISWRVTPEQKLKCGAEPIPLWRELGGRGEEKHTVSADPGDQPL